MPTKMSTKAINGGNFTTSISKYSICLFLELFNFFVNYYRFGISEVTTHAGVVLFSDAKQYTNVTIKLMDYLTTKSFNQAVMASKYYGYRTRIDLAFQKVEEELFTIAGGK